ncbi:MAG: exopolysaccharide biosynthesis protein [Candidatus Rokuibacteriota bacterium]
MLNGSLADRLRLVMDKLPPEGVTLVELRDLVGQDGLMLLTSFLTLVFMVPVSIPGMSTVFGAGILLIGLSRVFGKQLWIPRAIGTRVVSTDKLRGAFNRGLVLFQRLERVSRPGRLTWLTAGGVIGLANDLGLVLGAVLLMMPFGLIPLSNTLPAIALLLLAIGILQRDGVCMLLGHVMNALTMIYFAVLIGGGGVIIQQVLRRVWGS